MQGGCSAVCDGFMEASGGGGAHSLVDAYELKVSSGFAGRGFCGSRVCMSGMEICGVRKSAQGDEEQEEQVQRWDGMMREEAGRICKAAAVPFVTGFMEASGEARHTACGGGGAHSLVDAYGLKVRLHHLLERWGLVQDSMATERWGLVQDSMATERPSLVLPHLYLGSAIAARSFPLLHHLFVYTTCWSGGGLFKTPWRPNAPRSSSPTSTLAPPLLPAPFPLLHHLSVRHVLSRNLCFQTSLLALVRHVSKCAPHLALLALLSSPFSTVIPLLWHQMRDSDREGSEQMRDSDREDLSKYIDTTSSFLEAAISKGEGVLVHCYEGRSRSVSIVLAYLMTKRRMPLAEAWVVLQSAHPHGACPWRRHGWCYILPTPMAPPTPPSSASSWPSTDGSSPPHPPAPSFPIFPLPFPLPSLFANSSSSVAPTRRPLPPPPAPRSPLPPCPFPPGRMPLAEAWVVLHSAHPHAAPNTAFLRQLVALDRQLFPPSPSSISASSSPSSHRCPKLLPVTCRQIPQLHPPPPPLSPPCLLLCPGARGGE
ncbi:unnamed protein product [Closterium sp. NIES-64]|nr:unnamed protein product [Closterium sp. NIES-64]